MPYKYETKNCKNCIYCAKTVNGLYCLYREGKPKITNGGWCIDCKEKVRRMSKIKFDDKVLRDFAEWVKTQPIYVGRGHIDGDKEILIVREGKYEDAIEVYIKERGQ